LREVSIVGIGQVPVEKATSKGLRELGANVVRLAMADAGVDLVDALYASNMLADELQGQKHIAALIADAAGLAGIEALQIQAAMASGSAALRMAYLSVASGEADLAVAVGVEKMSEGLATPAMSKALDAKEVEDGATLISKNADLMRLYLKRHKVPADGLANFPVVAHRNARNNPNALYRDMRVTSRSVMHSRVVHEPLRLLDSSPICDGAAAVVLSASQEARAHNPNPVCILASSVSTDRFRVGDRGPTRSGWRRRTRRRRRHFARRTSTGESICSRYTTPSASWPACAWRRPGSLRRGRAGGWLRKGASICAERSPFPRWAA